MKKLVVFLILISLASCGKKQEIKISAINPVTGAPYPSLKYTIIEEKTGAFEEKYKTVAEGTLNENGVALVSLRLKNSSYLINLEKPANNCYMEPQDKTFEKNSSSFDFKFDLVPCAFMKLKIDNINCNGPTDTMKLFQGNQVNSFNYLNAWYHIGCVSWETTGFSDLPMGANYYKWEVTRNGITDTFYDTIHLEAGEYRTYEINY